MGVLRWCAGGDSITGCSGRWPFQALGIASVGDCGNPQTQAGCTYTSGKIIFRNMGISATRLESASPNDLVFLAPVYIDPIAALKSIVGTGTGTVPATKSVWLFTNSIGTNDGALGSRGSVAAYATANAAAAVARKTAGFDLAYMCTLIARGDGTMLDANRVTYNGLLTDPAWRTSNGIDGVFDLASATHAAPAFLPVNSGGNTTWYNADNVHPQDALSAELGVIALAGLNAIIAANGL